MDFKSILLAKLVHIIGKNNLIAKISLKILIDFVFYESSYQVINKRKLINMRRAEKKFHQHKH